jgi:hypothetical protein
VPTIFYIIWMALSTSGSPEVVSDRSFGAIERVLQSRLSIRNAFVRKIISNSASLT